MGSPTRSLQVNLSASLQLQVTPDAGQAAIQKVSENFNNTGTPTSIAPKQDEYFSTIPLAASGPGASKTIDLTSLGTLDYLWINSDGPITVQLGAGVAAPVQSIMIKDGPLPAGVTSITIANNTAVPGPAIPVNVTVAAQGH